MHQERVSKIAATSIVLVSAAFLLSACQQSGGSSGNPGPPTSATSTGRPGVAAGGQPVAYTPSDAYKPLSTCNLGMVNATTFGTQPVELRTGAINTFKGWLFAKNIDSPAYWLRLDGQHGERYLQARLQLDVERPDVTAVHSDAPRVSGFAVAIPANALPPGQYHAYLAVTSGDTTYICDSGRHVDANH